MSNGLMQTKRNVITSERVPDECVAVSPDDPILERVPMGGHVVLCNLEDDREPMMRATVIIMVVIDDTLEPKSSTVGVSPNLATNLHLGTYDNSVVVLFRSES